MLRRFFHSHVAFVQPKTTRRYATKPSFAKKALRPIHFEPDKDDIAERPFRIVGVRDAEIEDWDYPARVESDWKNKNRVLRNRFGHPNFISLWVDKLTEVEGYLKQEKVPYTSEGIVKGPEGHDVLVIPPSENRSSVEYFNLCDNPTMVELVQATPEIIQQYDARNEVNVLSRDESS
ncbi:uncharacterized protein PHALS_09715 [Plasmopara halstedii]|uniref:Uncharacterized protein n=1 Tax=Plasmopara halstedii TaxID=4781 RepID=A0A0P1AFU6_PLAHL|nr:uncharacterized protein PHALS_09715 [Plasmopara halstedii]CEG39470.1 hypothetical protein PHALS_09715 [Plasmopara halstedii]|eukprot:XP_024575839.1 hypothetical protein PHALS_09715 [Plasmopara halstedii]